GGAPAGARAGAPATASARVEAVRELARADLALDGILGRGSARVSSRSASSRALTRADLVLDGILGTGGRRGLPGHIAGLIADWAPRRRASLPAVDVPSDLRPDADGAYQRMPAERTVTFGGLKAELVDPRVSAFTGFIDVIDIGLDLDPALATAELLDAEDLVTDFPRPGRDGHKYSRGIAGILAGSEEYPGAGVLTTTSAV